MKRDKQNFLTWAAALAILISQATPWADEKPYLLGVVATLLGLPFARRAQDLVNDMRTDDETEAKP